MLVYMATNFRVQAVERVQQPDSQTYYDRSDVFFDNRTDILTERYDSSNWDWYFNYLESCQALASHNPRARAMYLLDMGYIPIVYMPTSHKFLTPQLAQMVDEKRIPNIHQPPSSFSKSYIKLDIDYDVWVSKLDVCDKLGVAPEAVTSEMVLRRLIL